MESTTGISVAGGIFQDIRGQAHRGWVSQDSQPGQVRYSAGGVARNIAENLARLQVPVRLFGMVGPDAPGQEMCRELEKTGVQIQGITTHPTHVTGTDLSLLSEAGELQASVTDLSICQALTPVWAEEQLDNLFPCEFLILETNLPIDTLQFLITEANRRDCPVVIDPVSQPLARRMAGLSGQLHLFCPNEGEWAAFQEADPKLKLEHVLLTQGALGLSWLSEGDKRWHQAAIEGPIKDVVGAGDSCLAAVVWARWKGYDIPQALQAGAQAAAYCIAGTETVSRDISPEALLPYLS